MEKTNQKFDFKKNYTTIKTNNCEAIMIEAEVQMLSFSLMFRRVPSIIFLVFCIKSSVMGCSCKKEYKRSIKKGNSTAKKDDSSENKKTKKLLARNSKETTKGDTDEGDSTTEVVRGTERGGPSRNGIFDVEPLKKFNGIKWTYSPKSKISTQPIGAGDNLLFSTKKGFLYALSKDTGKEVWKKKITPAVATSTEAAAGVFYVGTNKGQVYALSAATGKVIWQETPLKFVSSLLLDKYLFVGGDALVSLSPDEGKEIWRHTLKTSDIKNMASNNAVIVYTDWKALFAVNVKNGVFVWKVLKKEKTPFTLCHTGKCFFRGMDPALYENEDGKENELKGIKFEKEEWKHWEIGWNQVCTELNIFGSVVISNKIYSSSGIFGFGKVNLKESKAIWVRKDLENCSCTSKADDVLFAACSYHGKTFAALSAEDGKTIWSIKTPYSWVSCPWLEDKKVFFATERKVYALH